MKRKVERVENCKRNRQLGRKIGSHTVCTIFPWINHFLLKGTLRENTVESRSQIRVVVNFEEEKGKGKIF